MEYNAEPRRVVIPRIEDVPRLTDFVDMETSGHASDMARVEGFTTRLPRDGEPMTERTVVYLGYDENSLHVVFVCFDSEPARIRSHLTGRDRLPDSDDGVAVQLDTFRDLKHAYGFQVNPGGVQLDAFWTEGTGWDISFDTVWKSEGRITPQGYVVLVSVPFRSLRFPREDVQEWGLLLFRGIARKNEQAFWPAYSTKIAGRMNQAAVLEGLEKISPGRNAQFIPYMSGRSFRVIDDVGSIKGPRFISRDAEVEAGLDAKLVIRDSVSVDVAVNPDFSQVESDEPQVTVNKRFETFFPEKRPFFLENASFFDTPIPLLFTRRILQPQAGARVTGRIGPYALGGLLLSDRPDGLPESDVGVLRLSRDIGKESSNVSSPETTPASAAPRSTTSTRFRPREMQRPIRSMWRRV